MVIETVDRTLPPRLSDGEDREVLLVGLVHPLRVLIFEALLWIDKPLGAADLRKVFGNGFECSTIQYHAKAMARRRVLTEDELASAAGKRRLVFSVARAPARRSRRSVGF